MSKQEYEFHPYASIFPPMTGREFRELVADMQGEDGQREPITLFEGKILDGRHRYKACLQLGIEPKFRELNGSGDPVAFIVSLNMRRRDMTESQRGLVAAKLATLDRGRPKETAKTPTKSETKNPPQGGFTEAQAADVVNVSPRTVSRAKKVLREAPKKTVKEVEAGAKTLVQAEREVNQNKEKKETHFDKTGYPIPNAILADWQRAAEYKSALRSLHTIKLDVEKRLNESDLIFREIGKDTLIELQNAWTNLKSVLPYAVCPSCQGRNRKNCTSCKGRGWVSEFAYKNWFAKEVIELREKAIKK